MQPKPLRTTVVGSYPFPGWLEFASSHLDQFGVDDINEMLDDAVSVAVLDQVTAGLDVVTDGEQTRLDFNLSFYGFLEGIERDPQPHRRLGPPAHDQRSKHRIAGQITAPRGLGCVAEYQRLLRLAPAGPALKISVPGPYTLSGRLEPNADYPDRWAITEALVPIVNAELQALVAAGCAEICVDEPSMSCYGYREDPHRLVNIFNRAVAGIRGHCRLSTHLCFGNYKARSVAPRSYAPLYPAFYQLDADEVHVEMANREFAEINLIGRIAEYHDVSVGIVDTKNYYIETPDDIAARVHHCLQFAPAERLSFAPDCGLSQTARWAARRKLQSLVQGVQLVALS
ncbi:MAG: cobalamin-independent methionine synthase II family protein [Candidatus Solibacter usitatus]|nr:cobalamin-independent methionine synthase II family protein [Candidatus Solibacter usitatus]